MLPKGGEREGMCPLPPAHMSLIRKDRVSDVLDLSLVSKRFGFWPHITNIKVLTFKEIKHLSDCRIIGRTPQMGTDRNN
jgi:hypothetical protein